MASVGPLYELLHFVQRPLPPVDSEEERGFDFDAYLRMMAELAERAGVADLPVSDGETPPDMMAP